MHIYLNDQRTRFQTNITYQSYISSKDCPYKGLIAKNTDDSVILTAKREKFHLDFSIYPIFSITQDSHRVKYFNCEHDLFFSHQFNLLKQTTVFFRY